MHALMHRNIYISEVAHCLNGMLAKNITYQTMIPSIILCDVAPILQRAVQLIVSVSPFLIVQIYTGTCKCSILCGSRAHIVLKLFSEPSARVKNRGLGKVSLSRPDTWKPNIMPDESRWRTQKFDRTSVKEAAKKRGTTTKF